MTAAVAPLLTPRQSRILVFIRDYYQAYGFAPSMREIGTAVGLGSSSSVRHQLTTLERMGWIRRAPGRARALCVLNPADGSDT